MVNKTGFTGDFWGGTAAMLVALPSAIAFGVIVYASIGGNYGAYGAVAGIVGVAAVGIVAALLGGTKQLISAPSAPAAAVLSAFCIEFISRGYGGDSVFVMVMLVALGAGLIQILFGIAGLGRLIKYMPFPVVSGYLSGVGLYIIASQAPKFLGLPEGMDFWSGAGNLFTWEWQSIVVGTATIVAMLYAERIMRYVPAVIAALVVGIATYFVLGLADPSLYRPDNHFLIGSIGGSGVCDFLDALKGRFEMLPQLSWNDVAVLLLPALTLAALLSIDTLKTCVIVDSMTHSYHDSNRELIAQGSANSVSALIGGMPGSGTMGATMLNISAGASTRRSGIVAGLMAVIAFWMLGSYIAWIPVAVLSGILIVIGVRMIDRRSIRLLRNPKTALDFIIIATVAAIAVSVSLIVAAGVGLALAVILYIVQQIGMSVVYRRIDGSDTRSKIVRNRQEEETLRESGDMFSLYELHGTLFFGTANQLYSVLRNDLVNKKYIIIDMKRVQTVDITAAHILLQIKDILHEKDGYLILCRLPHKLPTGDDLELFFNQVGLLKHMSPIKVFDDLDDAIEWVEEKIIRENLEEENTESLLPLGHFDFFKGRHADTLAEIEALVQSRSFRAGEVIFSAGDLGGELFLIRRGLVRIMLPMSENKSMHLNTLGQGNFFGEFSFLEGSPQYTGAVAGSDTDVYVISREVFEQFSQRHKKASFYFMRSIAAVLAERLRSTSAELGEEYNV
jgi:SulP family sulfate permease